MNIKCDCCGCVLSFSNSMFLRGVVKIKTCRACYDKYLENVKSKYYVETYKGNDIYEEEGRYYPYWDCGYYFYSLEECKNRIDTKNVGLYIL